MKTLKWLILLACFAAGPVPAADEPHGKGEEKAAAAKAFKNVSVEEFAKLREDKRNQVLDVRTPREFAAGHLPGAVNIDFNGPDFQKKIAALEKDKTYLVHCAAGVRSSKACNKMSQLDFPHLYNLEGGFRAWKDAGQPVEK